MKQVMKKEEIVFRRTQKMDDRRVGILLSSLRKGRLLNPLGAQFWTNRSEVVAQERNPW